MVASKRNIDKNAKDILLAWMLSEDHFEHPYPTTQERKQLAAKAGIDESQVLNWFVNARKRIWQPLLVKMGKDVKDFLSPGRGSADHKRKAQQQIAAGDSDQPNKKPRLSPPPMRTLLTLFSNSPLTALPGPDLAASGSSQFSTTESTYTSNESVSTSTDSVYESEDSFTMSSSMSGNDPLPSAAFSSVGATPARKGQWTEEEEAYAHHLIADFSAGCLEHVREGVSLRTFLSNKLGCPPMRISKKFTKENKIGKLVYAQRCFDKTKLSKQALELDTLRTAFLASISQESVVRRATTAMSQVHGVSILACGPCAQDDLTPSAVESESDLPLFEESEMNNLFLDEPLIPFEETNPPVDSGDESLLSFLGPDYANLFPSFDPITAPSREEISHSDGSDLIASLLRRSGNEAPHFRGGNLEVALLQALLKSAVASAIKSKRCCDCCVCPCLRTAAPGS